MKKYKITIAILNYNRQEFLDRSIRSCINQNYHNKEIEIIIIDDGSSDQSEKIIKYFKKNYSCDIRFYKLKKNKGPGYCSKLAVEKAKGEFFIRVDSDDYLSQFAIENMSNILIHNLNFAYVFGDIIKINYKGEKVETLKLNTKSKKLNHGAGIMFRTKIIRSIGNYNQNLRQAEDYELIKKIDKKYNFFYLPIPYYRYYIHGKNTTLNSERNKIIKGINKNEF